MAEIAAMAAMATMAAMAAMAAMAVMAAIIINMHSNFKKKNYIYWQKCSKSQKVAAAATAADLYTIIEHYHCKSSCRS